MRSRLTALFIAVLVALVSSPAAVGQPAFSLSFPLPNRTPYTAAVNSVFDHAMASPYTANGVVVAYTGERGESQYGQLLAATVNGVPLYGFRQASGATFVVNGNYTGAGQGNYMWYDGHPGFDYRTTDQNPNGQINVLAAADGVLHKVVGSVYNTIYIDHLNGYTTHYLHLSNPNLVPDNTLVTRGQMIGITGDTGAPGSPHLHFEVQFNGIEIDPYGWSGSGSDPYTRATNINLWDGSACVATLVSPVSNASITFPQSFSWQAPNCPSLYLGFATSTTPSMVHSTAQTSGALLSEEYWGNVVNYLGGVPTYYWTVGLFNGGLFTPVASWRPFTVTPSVAGACCLPAGVCASLSAFQCSNQGGIYRGDGAACANSNCSSPGVVVIQPGPEGTDTFWGTSFVQSGAPDWGIMYYGGWGDFYYDYLAFDLAGSPSATATSSCLLYLYAEAAPNDPGLLINRITQSWTESGIAVTTNPASTFYTAFGPVLPPNGWKVVDITQLYRDWKNGAYPNYGIKLLPAANNQTNGNFASSDNADPTKRPKLVITTNTGQCYANCDNSSSPPILNANDFQCFLNKFAAGDAAANCDGSTAAPVLNANDFQCFLNKFAAGCP